MGQKVHPYALRLGIIRGWLSNWFAEDRAYTHQLLEDIRIRKFVGSRLQNAGIARINIERTANNVSVTLHTSKPGVVIGRGGRGVDQLRADVEKLVGQKVQMNVEEIKRPELDAQLVAENIAQQIERRVSFRRAMRQSIGRTMRMGAQGMRVRCAGRLGGREIAYAETDRSPEGRVPLHTLRADVDYGVAEAGTTAGRIGVKVWIYKGEILPERKPVRAEAEAEGDGGQPPAAAAEATARVQAAPAAQAPPVEAQPAPEAIEVPASVEAAAEPQVEVAPAPAIVAEPVELQPAVEGTADDVDATQGEA